MIDWKRKLTSRKLWVAIVGLVTGLLLLFGVDAERADKIGGVVLMFGSVVGYVLAEGLADSGDEITIYPQMKPPDEEEKSDGEQ